MASRFIAFGALALACIVAAGGGAYLAVRQTANPPAQAVNQPATQVPAAQKAPADIVSTPAAPADSPATSSQASSKAVPDANAGPSTAPPAATKPLRRMKTERAEPSREARTSEDPAQPSLPDSRPAVPPASSTETAPPSNPTPPQSIGQTPIEPQHEWVEVTVPSESVLGLQIQTAVSSETARVEDRVDARVTRDIRVDDRVAIPAGTQALGTVVQVERGGKVKDRAHFAIRFNTLVLPDGNRVSLNAEAVHREGPSPANKSAAKIGGATVGGAILGAILGGGKGAAIGGAIGAGGGTAAAMAGDREPATLPAGSIVNIRLMSPVTVTLDR